jgi:translation initiation factor eIF-2B subunit beta
LHHIREEYYNAAQPSVNTAQSYSLSSFVIMGQPRSQIHALAGSLGAPSRSNSKDGEQTIIEDFKPVLLDAVQDVVDELETVYENVSRNAKDHIHSESVHTLHGSVHCLILCISEIILTLGYSKTVEAFLKSAHHSRNFSVIVAETAPT